ncbi:hypothetical protein JOC34_000557 [Virgibacillus halotolerans]|uniref:hypothetical protein n=1 Tax=Virgibacillus halotolerans TaxID=1071053 RepID=UPI0019607189|nr:hypothetical protein [Virgibacillus halotolerans]MBM7598200.1 hypothetical protein [Virgibacillus halotolerans]
MLKIRQSYHGTGGREGYKYKVYNDKGKKIGEIKDFPIDCRYGDIIKIGDGLYTLTSSYDSDNPRHEKSEVMFHELQPYDPKPNFDLGEVI